MNQVLGFRGDELIVMVGIIGVVVIVITKVLADHSRKSQRDDMEATLKMEMIQRGMSAEEIERVLAARMDSANATTASIEGDTKKPRQRAGKPASR